MRCKFDFLCDFSKSAKFSSFYVCEKVYILMWGWSRTFLGWLISIGSVLAVARLCALDFVNVGRAKLSLLSQKLCAWLRHCEYCVDRLNVTLEVADCSYVRMNIFKSNTHTVSHICCKATYGVLQFNHVFFLLSYKPCWGLGDVIIVDRYITLYILYHCDRIIKKYLLTYLLTYMYAIM